MNANNKTTPTADSVNAFLASIGDPQRQADSRQLVELMREATGQPPVMWGSSIIGFGTHHYKYETGREGDTVAVGFAARKQALVLYSIDYYGQNATLAAKLGKHTSGKGCLYIKKLSDIDLNALTEMVKTAHAQRANVPN